MEGSRERGKSRRKLCLRTWSSIDRQGLAEQVQGSSSAVNSSAARSDRRDSDPSEGSRWKKVAREQGKNKKDPRAEKGAARGEKAERKVQREKNSGLRRDTGKSEMMQDTRGLTAANDSILSSFVEGLLVNQSAPR